MKKINKSITLTTLSLVAMLGMSDVANAKTKSFSSHVTYTCQAGKSVGVTYHFNRVGLPTSATTVLKGRTRTLPINLDRSDATNTYFGKEGGYNISADGMTSKNYRSLSGMSVFSPSSEILYKDCRPR